MSVSTALFGQPLFVTSIGLSAFLLFTLELLSGSLVLPVFGGTPAVWTTALCFFTGVLFIGYLYAHVIVTRLGQRRGGLLHLVVAAIVVVLTIFAPSDLGSLRNPQLPEAVNVLLVLALIAGAPEFLLASTSPLLSAWFAGRGGDAWWLYAASNAASLIALLAYPFVIAPTIPLSGQRLLLVLVLVLFVATLVGDHPGGPPVGDDHLPRDRPRVRAAAVDRTARYLPRQLRHRVLTTRAPDPPVAEWLVPAAATLMWIPYVLPLTWPVFVLVSFLLTAYAVIAIAVHGRLALDRPDDAHLTGFYLIVMSSLATPGCRSRRNRPRDST